MDDVISRAAALDALDEIESEVADGEGFQYEKWRSYIAELPSAQPQRKSAYLIDPNPYGKCSNCGQLIDIRDEYNYCPLCGARLDGESDV